LVTLLEPAPSEPPSRHVIRIVPVQNAAVLEDRIENVDKPLYDVATVRALANIEKILCPPNFLEPRGTLISWTTDAQGLAGKLIDCFSLGEVETVAGARKKVIAVYRMTPRR
jgi:hypothetical protein